MKKAIFVATAISLMLITACKKTDTSNTGGNAGGAWTFKSINYQAPGCDTSLGALVATVPASGNAKSGGELAVDFYNTTPSASGTFVVIKGINTLTAYNQVEVGVTDVNGNYYISTGNGNATVSVTLGNGKVTASGSAIELVNLNNPADSASLTFNVQQTD